MADPVETKAEKQRRRLINLGEVIALCALVISALGLWHSWNRKDDKPAVVVEGTRAIPLALRGTIDDNGKAIRLAPVEVGHALESLAITAVPPASGNAPFSGDPILSAAMVETWLPDGSDTKRPGAISVTIEARYIEMGETRGARQRYRIAYRWVDGGLFAGKSLRLTGITRA